MKFGEFEKKDRNTMAAILSMYFLQKKGYSEALVGGGCGVPICTE
jgi:hypothetical protein